MLKYGSFGLLLLFFIPLTNTAQSVFPHLKTYTSAEGLSLNNVNNAYPDNYGFLWVATEHGLNRFDGNNFTRFYASFNPRNGLPGNAISKVVCDSIMIWLAVKGRGLATFFDMATYFISFVHADDDSESLASNNINCMILSSKKVLYVGTDRGVSILVKESNRFKNILQHPITRKPLDVTAVTEDLQGKIWIATSDGDLLFINDKNEPIVLNNLPDAIQQSRINDMLFNKKSGELFLATSRGAWSIKIDDKKNVSLARILYGLDNINVNCIRSSGRDDIWIGTASDGIYLKEIGSNLLHYTNQDNDAPDGLVSNEVKDISFTRDGSVWISTPQGLQAWHKSRQRFRFYALSDKSKRVIPAGLSMVNDRIIASVDGGIWTGESQSVTPHPENITIQRFRTFDDEHYVVTNDGIFELSEKLELVRPARFSQTKELLEKAEDIQKINLSEYWVIANDKCVYSVNIQNDSATKLFTAKQNTPLFFNGRKSLFLFLDDSIKIFEKGLLKRTLPRTLLKIIVHDLFDDGKNIWIATESDGFYKCDSAFNVIRKFTTADGLSDENIFSITSINNQLWLATSRGLNMFDPATNKFRAFFEENGLRSHEFKKNGKYFSRDGTLYLSTEKGIVAFDPQKWNFPGRSDAKIFISKVVIGQTELDRNELAAMNTDFTLTADYGTSITFSFAAGINYNTSDQALLYSVSGYTWSTIKAGSDIRLEELRPGRHILYVMQPENDQFNEKTIEIWVHIIPAWYQRAEFFVVLVLLISASAYFIYRYRIKELKKLHAVRTKISQDLHDEVGATLSGISMYSHLTREQMKSGAVSEIDRSLGVIQHAASEMVNKLNDIVWVVNPKNDTLQKIIDRLEEYIREITAAKSIQVNVVVAKNISEIKFPMDTRRNIYLLCKEAINNSVKYSGASSLNFEVVVKDGVVDFMVNDNGRGFDIVTAKKGNGIDNMRRRAREMGAKFVLKSRENEGVQVLLQCNR